MLDVLPPDGGAPASPSPPSYLPHKGGEESCEIIVDSFAGGGGASTGIERALGRSPDVAINHDEAAIAMHRANHPETLHLSNNIWTIDPDEVMPGRPIGLLWASPDCTHHSKAKGGVPIRAEGRNSRDLGWVVVLWAQRRRPRVIILENVEEWRQWGPLVMGEDGELRPDPERKGVTFKAWVRALRKLGYVVEWRELRACDYGAPTIRKRLYVIARCDGQKIVWPAPTHGDPKSEAVRFGRLKPWRTAAEIIDWSLPCPSIFETSAEIFERYGVRAKRPLADATMARIAKGVKRYVLEAAEPFIVRTDMASAALRNGVNGVQDPLRTVTTAGGHALVTPFVTKFRANSVGHGADEPLHTITAHASETHPGGAAPLGLVTPHLMMMRNAQKPFNEADAPMHTITAGGANPALVAPYLVPRYGEREGQEPRTHAPDAPHPTVVPTGNAQLVAAFLAQHNNHRSDIPHEGRAVDTPISTLTTTGSHQSLVAATLSHSYTSNTAGGEGSLRKPIKTIVAGGQHAALVAAFLAKYYGAGLPSQAADEPLHTLTAKPRHGLVTVTIAGELYEIADIGMRMLTPRERFNAQGFPADYVIDPIHNGKPLTLEQQGQKCGNSVCPDMADALVSANCPDLAVARDAEAA